VLQEKDSGGNQYEAMSPALTRTIFVCAGAWLSACGPRVSMPGNASIGGRTRATPVTSPAGAPPRIVAIALSSIDVRRRTDWSGTVVTGTNVASVEIRTNLFSIDVPRTTYGRFGFRTHVLDLPPIFVRPYRLRVIARNARGAEAEEDLPFRFR